MLKYWLLLYLFLSPLILVAQKASDKAIEEACNCIKFHQRNLIKSNYVDMCVVGSLIVNKKELKREFKIRTDNDSLFLGQVTKMILKKFIAYCPESKTWTTVYPSGMINPDTLRLDQMYVCATMKEGSK